MPVRYLLLALGWGVALSAARAQGYPAPTYFLRHPAGEPRAGFGLPAAVPVPAGALPATWATAALLVPAQVPQAAPTSLATRSSLAALPAFPRRDATGVRPLYDLYRDLPEDFRKHTLPAVYTEPLPVQLLRGLLGQ